MQIVIELSEVQYRQVQSGMANPTELCHAILSGTLLPQKHGRLIDAGEITAFLQLERNNQDVESLDEFTTILKANIN